MTLTAARSGRLWGSHLGQIPLQELESYLDLFGDDTEPEAREYLGRAEFETAQIDYAFDSVGLTTSPFQSAISSSFVSL